MDVSGVDNREESQEASAYPTFGGAAAAGWSDWDGQADLDAMKGGKSGKGKGRPLDCHNCGGDGHPKRICASEPIDLRNPNPNSPKCDNCNGKGHLKAQCTSRGGGKYVVYVPPGKGDKGKGKDWKGKRGGKGAKGKGKGDGSPSQCFKGKGSGLNSVGQEYTDAEWAEWNSWSSWTGDAGGQSTAADATGQQVQSAQSATPLPAPPPAWPWMTGATAQPSQQPQPPQPAANNPYHNVLRSLSGPNLQGPGGAAGYMIRPMSMLNFASSDRIKSGVISSYSDKAYRELIELRADIGMALNRSKDRLGDNGSSAGHKAAGDEPSGTKDVQAVGGDKIKPAQKPVDAVKSEADRVAEFLIRSMAKN